MMTDYPPDDSKRDGRRTVNVTHKPPGHTPLQPDNVQFIPGSLNGLPMWRHPMPERSALNPDFHYDKLSSAVIQGLCLGGALLTKLTAVHPSEDMTKVERQLQEGLTSMMSISHMHGFQKAEIEGLKAQVERLKAEVQELKSKGTR